MRTSKAISPYRRAYLVSHRGIHVGTDTTTGQGQYLKPRRLTQHMHVIGPPGVGKTRFQLNLFEQLQFVPEATVILFNPKGELGNMARDWTIANGLASRLALFDPGDINSRVGFDPLKPNGLPKSRQVKAVREAIRAAFGQSSFDNTLQFARISHWALSAARERGFTFCEAIELIRPDSPLRREILPTIEDPYVRGALEYFDSLRTPRQEELAASTLARLEPFVNDPVNRRIITERSYHLDLGHVIGQHQILIVNLEQYRPLNVDDVRLFGRMLINTILAYVFERPKDKRTPVFLIIDEVQTFLTEDLCTALSQGRELGLSCVLGHQYMGQLLPTNSDRSLWDAVRSCARTKVIFGGGWVEDLEVLVRDAFIEQYDPRTTDPQHMRVSQTRGATYSRGRSVARPISKTISSSITLTDGENESVTAARQRTSGRSAALGVAHTDSQGTARATATSSAIAHSKGTSSNAQHGSGLSQTIPGGQSPTFIPAITTYGTDGVGVGQFAGDTSVHSFSEALIESLSHSDTETTSIGTQESEGSSRARQRGTSRSHAAAKSQGFTIGLTPSVSEQHGDTWSHATQPFSLDDFLAVKVGQVKRQPGQHALLYVPAHAPVFLRLPNVPEPRISDSTRAAALERIYDKMMLKQVADAQPSAPSLPSLEPVEYDERDLYDK
jgi:hypothetical protein